MDISLQMEDVVQSLEQLYTKIKSVSEDNHSCPQLGLAQEAQTIVNQFEKLQPELEDIFTQSSPSAVEKEKLDQEQRAYAQGLLASAQTKKEKQTAHLAALGQPSADLEDNLALSREFSEGLQSLPLLLQSGCQRTLRPRGLCYEPLCEVLSYQAKQIADALY